MTDRPFVVIAFRGKLGSGKTFCADKFTERVGKIVTRVSFAGPLKKMAGELLPWRHEQLYGTTEEKNAVDPRFGISCREFMQKLGESARIHLWQEVWIEAAMRYIAHNGPRLGGFFLIDDCRYPNEAVALRGHKNFFGAPTYLVHLDRMDHDQTYSKYSGHMSETGVDEARELAHVIVQKPIMEMGDAVMQALDNLIMPATIGFVIKNAVPR